MKQLLLKSTRLINRRRLLQGTAASAFSVFAAASLGKSASAVVAAPCTGPYGTGSCGSANCSGSNCRNAGIYKCYKITGFCPTGTACWAGPGGTCCDCKCHEGTSADPSWYCYCFG